MTANIVQYPSERMKRKRAGSFEVSLRALLRPLLLENQRTQDKGNSELKYSEIASLANQPVNKVASRCYKLYLPRKRMGGEGRAASGVTTIAARAPEG